MEKLAAIYTRVSSYEQAKTGISLESQVCESVLGREAVADVIQEYSSRVFGDG